MESNEQGLERLVGQVVAGYRLERILGAGLTGGVYLGKRVEDAPKLIERTQAAPIVLPDEAAVKLLVLPLQLGASEREEFRKRFLREAETLQRLRHPHVVSVLASGEDNGHLYMVLPYLSGGTLADALITAEPLPLERVATWLVQIAAGLDYAHEQGVIHRDIKPANVLLDADGKAYLGDFSIARLQEVQTKHTTTGKIMGTFAYMAPEQARGSDVTAAADIYSLGCLVYQLVTGVPPFTGTDLPQLILQHVQAEPPGPRGRRPDLPEPAEAAILCALAKDPTQRFATAAQFAQAFVDGLQNRWGAGLTAYVLGAKASAAGGGLHDAVTEPAGHGAAPLPTRRRPRPHPVVLVAAALLLLACSVLTVGLAGTGFGAVGNAFALLGLGGSHATPTATQRLASAASTATRAVRPTATPAHTSSGGGSGGGGSVQPKATATHTTAPTPTFTPTPTPTPTATQPPTYAEIGPGIAHTWTNYTNAGGTQGPSVQPYTWTYMACAVQGFKVADGNPWWYRIAQSPWNNQYYVSADAFYNNGASSGSLSGTPWVDPKVPLC